MGKITNREGLGLVRTSSFCDILRSDDMIPELIVCWSNEYTLLENVDSISSYIDCPSRNIVEYLAYRSAVPIHGENKLCGNHDQEKLRYFLREYIADYVRCYNLCGGRNSISGCLDCGCRSGWKKKLN